MILVTRLNGVEFAINPDLIERIAEQPDTTMFLVDGSSHIVTETLAEVLDRIIDARAEVIARASLRRLDITPNSRHLEAVPSADETSQRPPRSSN